MVDWRAVARDKRAAQAALIPPSLRLASVPDGLVDAVGHVESCGLLSAEELRLTATTDGRALASMLAAGEVSSAGVAAAFVKRAAALHQLTGCCTELFFDAALRRAEALDRHLQETGEVVGPLHGLPVSVKDGFDVEGVDSTVGWVGLVGKPAPRNGPEVEFLLGLGAVIYCKTNIPQSLMMSDSYNHVFGQSVNPFNRNLISGGSSGGEGALVGGRGSILGIGTDIGGSIRIPACLQGLYDPWNVDPRLFPVPWRKELAELPKKPLKLAFIFDDGVVKPQPPVARAIREVAEKLKAAGHEVVEWDTSLHEEGIKLWYKAVLADGGKKCRDTCALIGEPLIEGMVVGQEKDFLSIAQRQELSATKLAFEKTFLAQWNAAGIDGIIMPVLPWVNYTPKTWVRSKQWLGYSALWNLLNYAALTVPGSRVDAKVDQPGEEWKKHIPRNDSDAFNYEQYDVELVKGMPVGLQVVTGRFGEEKAVAIAKVLESLK
ncbi:putative acetamidase protein [Neofusicoccum parvum UCRNP2]|uniref:amidase n=1 Tax=Botryosphaeria parva (strain UCR-NP2) TaxID=1287680 RepID=R1GKI4_BOTPV|nr:putative acetamidase protein [Neofusicoccum parvum UCRNP2]